MVASATKTVKGSATISPRRLSRVGDGPPSNELAAPAVMESLAIFRSLPKRVFHKRCDHEEQHEQDEQARPRHEGYAQPVVEAAIETCRSALLSSYSVA